MPSNISLFSLLFCSSPVSLPFPSSRSPPCYHNYIDLSHDIFWSETTSMSLHILGNPTLSCLVFFLYFSALIFLLSSRNTNVSTFWTSFGCLKGMGISNTKFKVNETLSNFLPKSFYLLYSPTQHQLSLGQTKIRTVIPWLFCFLYTPHSLITKSWSL